MSKSICLSHSAKSQDIIKHLVSSEHGFEDFDISGLAKVHRVCVRHDIKEGDTFNVYCGESTKLGAIWLGTVEVSLASFATKHLQYKELLR